MYRGSVNAESTNCNEYLHNLDELSLKELIDELESLAAAWRKTPRRAWEFRDRVLCNGLTIAIRQRFRLDYYIFVKDNLPNNYQVYTPPRRVR